jgi:hypothetical protein
MSAGKGLEERTPAGQARTENWPVLHLESAKCASGVEFMKENRRGFWEKRGHRDRGEPFAEERYSYQEAE